MTSPRCHLTAKDFNYLQSLLAGPDHGDGFVQLLRRKLGGATLLLDHTIDRRIATIDSRVRFTVGGGYEEERILARDEKGTNVALVLPVTTLRGLALLGLKENDVFPLRRPDGIIEPIRLVKVVYQPEAASRDEAAGAVLQFHPRWVKSLGNTAPSPADPSDNDPGPGAA